MGYSLSFIALFTWFFLFLVDSDQKLVQELNDPQFMKMCSFSHDKLRVDTMVSYRVLSEDVANDGIVKHEML